MPSKLQHVFSRTTDLSRCWLDDGKTAGRAGVEEYRRIKMQIGRYRITVSWKRKAPVYESCLDCKCPKAYCYADNYGTDGLEETRGAHIWQYCPRCGKHFDLQDVNTFDMDRKVQEGTD